MNPLSFVVRDAGSLPFMNFTKPLSSAKTVGQKLAVAHTVGTLVHELGKPSLLTFTMKFSFEDSQKAIPAKGMLT